MSSLNKVAIIDYGIGNLYSVKRACDYVGLESLITANKKEISDCDALILPGVGAFGNAMKNLRQKDLIDSIQQFVKSGKYVMGICLGMQLLMDYSDEFGKQSGLNLIKGGCKKFDFNNIDVKVPQISWNKIYSPNHDEKFEIDTPLSGISYGAYMYFVHSYYVETEEENNILSLTSYNNFEYCSSVRKDNIFGFQFHPEKSGKSGLLIYENFKNLIKNDREKKY
jgi:glutamine amidotransferase